MADIRTQVIEIIVDKIGVDEIEVKDNASFTNDLGVDSLDVMEILLEVEKTFNIKIPDEDAEKLGTVGSVINYIIAQKS